MILALRSMVPLGQKSRGGGGGTCTSAHIHGHTAACLASVYNYGTYKADDGLFMPLEFVVVVPVVRPCAVSSLMDLLCNARCK